MKSSKAGLSKALPCTLKKVQVYTCDGGLCLLGIIRPILLLIQVKAIGIQLKDSTHRFFVKKE